MGSLMNLAVMYHYVMEPEEWKGSVPISPEAFEQQIDALGKHYEFVLPDDLGKPSSRPKCVLTFDDATRDQYEHAFRILCKKGVPGYFAVMSGPLAEGKVPIFHLVHAALSYVPDQELWEQLRAQLEEHEIRQLPAAHDVYGYESSIPRRYIKYAINYLWDDARSRSFLEGMVYTHFQSKERFIDTMYISVEQFAHMQREGMALGVHCVHHVPYGGDAQAYCEQEIVPCETFMREQFGIQPVWYTPPFGGGARKMEMFKDLRDILVTRGYKGAFTTVSGMIDRMDNFWMNRIDCNDRTFFSKYL